MGNGSPLTMIMDRWNSLNRARQIALGGIVAGAVVVLYFVFIASSAPNLVVAYTDLTLEDSAAIADQLEKDGVPYEIRGAGSQIAVPAKQVAEVRLNVAAAGLGSTGGVMGLELFDKTNFGATDRDKEINFVRAIQGELVRSINTVEGVRSSRVLLSMPEEALFKEDQEDPKASVVLQLKPGVQLDKEQIRAITNLVASSVEGLKPSGITIMDAQAAVLFDGASQDSPYSAGATANQLDIQRTYERQLQASANEMLTKVVGPVRSNVTVRAELNWDNVTSVEELFATAPTIRSSTTTNESFTGNNVSVGDVPGTGNNGGAAGGTDSANGNSTYTRTETTTNNEVSKTTTSTQKAAGGVDRLSVSVVLDESVTPQQEQAIRGAVAAAVGLDQTRGDLLNVVRLPFDASVTESFIVPAADGMQQYLSYVKLLVPVLAVILAFVLVMLLLRSLSKRQAVFIPQYIATATAGGPSVELPTRSLPAIEAGPLGTSIDPAEERVLQLANNNPKAVADVVQTWMREDDH